MAQTKLGSFVEAWANIAVGFAINWCANMAILPLFGFHVTGGQAFGIGVIFTGISLARQYVLRRWFNGLKFGQSDKSLHRAAFSLYMAGRWDCRDMPANEQAALWESLRDALNLPKGTATSAGAGSEPTA